MSDSNRLETDHCGRNATNDAVMPMVCECDSLLTVFSCFEKTSKGIVDDAKEGESYEVLVRRVQGLHDNLAYMAAYAKAVQFKRALAVSRQNVR